MLSRSPRTDSIEGNFFIYGHGIWQDGIGDTPREVSHRLRDMFAVELLLAGVPIERLSMLLGHQSIRITEKHYAPWTRSRQEQIESDLTAAWKTDPMLSKKAGTKGVQIQKGPAN